MNITINGKDITLTDGASVADALEAAGIEPKGIAIALNDIVVPKDRIAATILSESDRILIIKAFYGG